MMNTAQEARLIELSELSPAQRREVQPATEEERAFIETLDHISELQPPAPSIQRMRQGHRQLMQAIEEEESKPRPWLARILGRPAPALRAAPIAFAAAAIFATAVSAAVLADVPSPNTAFSEVLSALGIKDSGDTDETPPTPTPANPPQAPLVSPPQDGANEEAPLIASPITEDWTPEPPIEDRGRREAAPGQGGENPGNGGGNGVGVGQGGTPPGQGGDNPGQGLGPDGTPPGQGEEAPGQSGENPGQGVGHEGTLPGQGEEAPGNSGNAGQGAGNQGNGQGSPPEGAGSGNGQGNGQGGGNGNNPN
jgi:hypothetical protein